MRSSIKTMLVIISAILVLPLIIVSKLAQWMFNHDTRKKIFIYCGEILSLIPTIVGTYLRKAFYWATCENVAIHTQFLFGSMLSHREITIKKGVIVGPFTYLGYAKIGRNVVFGSRITVISGKYQHGKPADRLAKKEVDEVHEVIEIGDNSWIGSDSTILANIGNNCTVGAGSVVFKEIPDGSTVMGNPARRVNLDTL